MAGDENGENTGPDGDVAQRQEDTKKSRTGRKAAVTRQSNKVIQVIAERKTEAVKNELETLKEKFKNFEQAHESYHELLETETAIEESDNYFFAVQKDYISALNNAHDFLEKTSSDANAAEAKFVVKTDDSLKSKEILNLLNFPRLEIQKFDGNPIYYHSFVAMFDEVVGCSQESDQTKLTRLLQFTEGKAHDSIMLCADMSDGTGYRQARKILYERYGNTHIVTQRLINELRDGKAVKRPEELETFCDQLRNCAMTLRQLGKIHEVQSQNYILQIIERLQPFIKNRWKRRALEIKKAQDRYPSFDEFVEFVVEQTLQETDPVYGKMTEKRSEKKADGKVSVGGLDKKSSTFSMNVSQGSKGYKCVLCKSEHRLFYCQKFREMKPFDRLRVVTDNKLCENCLLSNHATVDCRKPSVCTVPGCGARHTKFIHVDQRVAPGSENSAAKPQVKVVRNANVNTAGDVHMPVVAVKINGECEACSILDSASTSSFCTQSLIEYLNIQGSPVTYSISTLNKPVEEVQSVSVTLNLSSLDGHQSLVVSNVYVVEEIPFKSSCPISHYPHLKGIDLVAGGQKIDLLLGQDNAEALIPLEVRKGNRGEPFACKTLFGWCINGLSKFTEPTNGKVVANFISSSLSVSDDVDKLWRIENEGVCSDERSWSVEDRQVMELWDKSVQLVQGHYELPIPWKQDVDMPNNVAVAASRLKSLKSGLAKKGLFAKYDDEIQKLLQNGYAELVPDVEIENKGKVWYLPHQAVVTEKKPDKLRVVFDCASKYCGKSLNSMCLRGPDLNNKLLNVLLRFRQHQFAFTADIEAMYNQVTIPIYDRNALRFLWDGDGILRHYRMTSHLFGGVWCAASATYAVRRTLVDFEASDQVADTIYRSFYVDDCLKSVQEKEEVLQLCESVTNCLSKAGFRLTKFIINDAELLQRIPEEHRAKEVRDLDSTACSKVLGTKWDVVEDKFFVSVNVRESDCISRKQMLSTIASCFDPLGLVCPMVVAGKILFQDATRLKYGWDDNIPHEMLCDWNKWIARLRELDSIRVPRCIKPNLFDDSAIELHFFSDAGMRAYGVCCYVRCTNRHGQIHTSLLVSKTRVAPVKSITIPRLELQAAVLSARLSDALHKELDISLNQSYFWVDSELVLKYIANETKRFHVFVENRVSEIRQLTSVSQWKHIPGKENPADLLTKPLRKFDPEKWFSGPEFLKTHKSDWNLLEVDASLPMDDPEVKAEVKMCAAVNVDLRKHPIDSLVEHFSSWYRIKRAVAWLVRLKACFKSGTSLKGKLSVDELQIAENLVLRHVQKQAFAKEIKELSNGKSLHPGSSVRSLCPFLAQDGLLRVGGRLNLSNDALCKQPILIPHSHPISQRIALYYHNKAHLGTEWVLSDLRSKFWITKGRVVVKSVSRNCVTCRKLFAPASDQKMADLPFERLEAFKSPFSYVGIDCFGPIFVRQGRSEVKRYGCVFSCLSVRAIHLEKLCSLDTNSLLNALRRFISRRGLPEKVFCDNGTNLVGASSELSRCLKELQADTLHDFCVKNGFQWHFNPPQASHMGGIWERLIRTVRKVFAGVFNAKHRMSDEVLETIFCEIEYIINSRPITKLSEDPNDGVPLCPNQLLLNKSNQFNPPCVTNPSDVYRSRWKFVQFIADQFWKKWILQYLPELQRRSKWQDPKRNFAVGDLVLLKDENTPRYLWPLGLVVEVYKSDDDLVRSIKVKTKSSQFVRPVTKAVFLEGSH